MNTTDIITIGLDVGYGLTKAVADNGRQACFESRVAPAEFIRFQADLGARAQVNGLTLHDPTEGPLFVGELASSRAAPARCAARATATGSPTPSSRTWPMPPSPCCCRASSRRGCGSSPACRSPTTATPLTSRSGCWATHPILLEGRSLTVDVQDVLVVPQPFGALLSLILDERGHLVTRALDLVEGRVAVLDVGQQTTDLILVEGLEYIEARSGSIEVGVSTAVDMIRKVLLDDYRVTYEPHEVEQALRRGWLVVDGKKRPLDGLASERLDPIARAIEAQARTLWNLSTLTALVLAGGGALALRPWLEPRFAQAIYAPDAAMANAVGFLRYGLRQWERGG